MSTLHDGIPWCTPLVCGVCGEFEGGAVSQSDSQSVISRSRPALTPPPVRSPSRLKSNEPTRRERPLILTMQRGRAVRTCTSSPRRHTRRAAQTTRGCVRRALRGGSAGTTPSSGQRPTRWHPTPRQARQWARRRPAKAVRAGRGRGSRDAAGRRRIGGAA